MKSQIKFLTVFFFSLVLFSCTTKTKENNTTNDTIVQSNKNVLNTKNLKSQYFTIQANKDTIIQGKAGTSISIEKNTFIDNNGKLISGNITIELKEAISLLDMTLGNLTTLSNNNILESDGMIYIQANANNTQLKIASSKSLKVNIPAQERKNNMLLYSGELNESTNTMNWTNPIKIETPKLENQKNKDNTQKISLLEPEMPLKADKNDNRIMSLVFDDTLLFPELQHYNKVRFRVNDDCNFQPEDANNYWYKVELLKSDKEGEYIIKLQGYTKSGTIEKIYQVTPVFEGDDYKMAINEYNKKYEQYEKKKIELEKKRIELEKIREQRLKRQADSLSKINKVNQKINATNYSISDPNNAYIFELKELGWANVDRLYHDPHSEPIELITKISNYEDADFIYITLIFKDKKIQIPGYQRKDKTFGFTHNDNENLVLPIGETVIILATTYINNTPLYDYQSFKIDKKQSFTLTLKETTYDELKEKLKIIL